MSKFEEKFREPFEALKNNPEGVPNQSRNLKRSQELVQQSQTQDIAKKAKQMQEPCGVSKKISAFNPFCAKKLAE